MDCWFFQVHEVHVHLRCEPLGHIGGRDPVREGDEAFGV